MFNVKSGHPDRDATGFHRRRHDPHTDSIPLIITGYFTPVLGYGVWVFLPYEHAYAWHTPCV